MSNTKTAAGQITEGTIWKQLLFFFFPILLGTFFQQFYNTIDMVIVGQFVGTEALASVGGSAAQIVNLIVGFFTGLTSGAGVIISQFFGAGDRKNLNASIHTAYAFSIVGSILFMIIGFWASPFLLEAMNTTPELLPDSNSYLRIYFAGILFVFLYNTGSAILRAMGDSRRPLYYLIICSLLNIALDLVMVVFLKLGVRGVAIATVAAQAFSAMLVTRALMKGGELYRLKLREIRIHLNLLRSQLYVGLPSGFQTVMYSFSNILIQAAVNVYGTKAVAAWSTFGKIDAMFWMISGAFGVSITTFVGQNYGAQRYDRIEKGIRVCMGMYVSASVLLSCIMMGFGKYFLGIFTTDTEVIRIGVELVKVICPCYALFMCVELLSSALRSMNDVIIPTILTLCGICLLRIVWVGILDLFSLHLSVAMIAVIFPITWTATSVLFIVYYLYRKRRMPGFVELRKKK
jgi:putative MATE family efflux protein